MINRPLNVLIACECSQTVCIEFRKLGDNAFSCDIVEQYGNHPEWHIQCDVLNILNGNCEFTTNDGVRHFIDKWDLVIAHPPCTYLSNAQLKLYNRNKYGDDYVNNRLKLRKESESFFLIFTKLNSPTMIENPVGIMNSMYRKPDQIVHPYQFGDAVKKSICLWLFKLPKLQPTNVVDIPERIVFSSGKSMDRWYYETSLLPQKQRSSVRSKTFKGIAEAIATQYHNYIKMNKDAQ